MTKKEAIEQLAKQCREMLDSTHAQQISPAFSADVALVGCAQGATRTLFRVEQLGRTPTAVFVRANSGERVWYYDGEVEDTIKAMEADGWEREEPR